MLHPGEPCKHASLSGSEHTDAVVVAAAVVPVAVVAAAVAYMHVPYPAKFWHDASLIHFPHVFGQHRIISLPQEVQYTFDSAHE